MIFFIVGLDTASLLALRLIIKVFLSAFSLLFVLKITSIFADMLECGAIMHWVGDRNITEREGGEILQFF